MGLGTRNLGRGLLLAGLVLSLFLLVLAEWAAVPPSSAAGSGPWDLGRLRRTPKFETRNIQQVTEGQTQVTLSEVYYEGEPWMGKPTRVFAYYARPAAAEKRSLPAVVLVHGGGGQAFPNWARMWAARGYAAIAMDLAGKGPERQPLPDGGPDQSDEWKFRRLKDGVKNSWPYYAVAAVLRGASVVRSFPEVNSSRVGITGISWGGYLTCLAMSLDDRFKAAVPVYGCGFLHENSAWVSTLQSLPEEERRTWTESFDPSSYLPRCKTPVLWMNGTNDFAYPLDSYRKSYRAVKALRTLCVTVKMPHSHPAGWERPEIQIFLDSILRREELPTAIGLVGRVVVTGDKVVIPYISPSAIQQVRIHWTTELDKPWQQREWQTANGNLLDLDTAEAKLPTPQPMAFFVTLTDNRGAVISSEHLVSGEW